MPGVHLTIARAHATLRDRASALDAYRNAMKAEIRVPNVRVLAYLEFAWFVFRNEVIDVYDEALQAIEVHLKEDDLRFPFRQYRYFAIVALASEAEGDLEYARNMAGNALRAADVTRGPFHKHPTVGVVRIDDAEIHEKLKRLAG